MALNKTDFFKDLSGHLSEPMYLTDKTDQVDEEIKHNHWAIATPSDIVAQATTADFLEFIEAVKDNYKVQLDRSALEIDLIFYLWVEEPGQLCFNFINSNHDALPFGCKLRYADHPEEIVDEYLRSGYHDQVIPWNELEAVETPEEIEKAVKSEKESHDNFVLTVYREKIKKQK